MFRAEHIVHAQLGVATALVVVPVSFRGSESPKGLVKNTDCCVPPQRFSFSLE